MTSVLSFFTLFPEHKALMLSDNRGAAFNLNPPRGFLEPYQSQEIVVAAYNNMWGKYRDKLTVSVLGELCLRILAEGLCLDQSGTVNHFESIFLATLLHPYHTLISCGDACKK